MRINKFFKLSMSGILSFIFIFLISIQSIFAYDLNTYVGDKAFTEVVLEDNNNGRNILGFEYVKVKINLDYNSSKKQHVWSFNLDVPTSIIKKPPVKLKAQILRSDTENGTYKNYGSLANFGNVNTIKNYKHSVPAKTGYYKVKVIYQIKPDGSSSYNKEKALESKIGLINRTAKKWTESFKDSKSGKTLGKPRANYTKNTIHKRPSNLNKTYYNEYKKRYGVTLNSSLYDVHHIKPLAYGGDNSFSNLIHLPKSIHKKVTSWFSGY